MLNVGDFSLNSSVAFVRAAKSSLDRQSKVQRHLATELHENLLGRTSI
jgi:hypothetical protein